MREVFDSREIALLCSLREKTARARGVAAGVGDARDDARMPTLRKILDLKKLPAFMAKPMMSWCAHSPRVSNPVFIATSYTKPSALAPLRHDKAVTAHELTRNHHELTRNHLPRLIRSKKEMREAEADPFRALAILRAMQKETKNMSDEFIAFIWILLQDDVCPEIQQILKLDINGEFPYANPRGGKSMDECLANHLPDGFLDGKAFAPGRSAFYCQGIAQSCTDLKRSVQVLPIEHSTDRTFRDETLVNVKVLVDKKFTHGITPYAGHSDRDAETRLKEKIRSKQLFGRHAQASARIILAGKSGDAQDADGDEGVLRDADDDDFASEAISDIAAESDMAVVNKVFSTKRFFAAVALIAGKAYRELGRGLSDMGRDYEAMVGAVTGSMVERGGTNVHLLGCSLTIDSR